MRLRRTPLLVLQVCSVLLQPSPCLAADSALSVEDVVSMQRFLNGSTLNLSADGEWVAYTIDDGRKKRASGAPNEIVGFSGSYVLVTRIKTGDTKRMTDEQSSSWRPVWSLDGLRLAYYSNHSGSQQLCVWERITGISRCVGNIETGVTLWGYAQTPQWTVGGDKLLARVVSVGKNVSNSDAAGSQSPLLGPNEDRPTVTVYRSSPGVDDPSQTAGTVPTAASSWPTAASTLALVDIKTGDLETLSQAQDPVWYSLSPSGRYIAYTIRNESANSYQPICDLLVLDLTSRRVITIAAGIKTWGSSVSWSPDSTTLALTTFDAARWPDIKGDCVVISVSGEHLQNITPQPHASFATLYSPPLWNGDGTAIYLVPYYNGVGRSNRVASSSDSVWMVTVATNEVVQVTTIPGRRVLTIVAPRINGRISSVNGLGSLLVLTFDEQTKKAGCFKVNVMNGAYRSMFESDKFYSEPVESFNDTSTNGQTVVFVAEETSKSPNVWAITSNERPPFEITRINPQLDRVSCGSSSLIEWRSLEGEPMQGAVLLPPNYEKGKRYPVIVSQYPGQSRSKFLNNYGSSPPGGDNIEPLLSTRGYVVFLPDSLIGPSRPMADIAESILPGVNKLVELGIADPDRLGVMGMSYGGYGVLSLLVQTRRFKAAVDRDGAFIDRVSQYGNLWSNGSSIAVFANESLLGGTIWEGRDRYIENSPIFYLDRVQTPLLIIQGAQDRNAPPGQSEEVFVGLRRLGKEVEYAKYEREGHTIKGYANSVDYLNRTIAWFDRYLKGATRPETAEASKTR